MNLQITPRKARRLTQPLCGIVAILFTIVLSASFVQSTSSVHWLGSETVSA